MCTCSLSLEFKLHTSDTISVLYLSCLTHKLTKSQNSNIVGWMDEKGATWNICFAERFRAYSALWGKCCLYLLGKLRPIKWWRGSMEWEAIFPLHWECKLWNSPAPIWACGCAVLEKSHPQLCQEKQRFHSKLSDHTAVSGRQCAKGGRLVSELGIWQWAFSVWWHRLMWESKGCKFVKLQVHCGPSDQLLNLPES